MRHSSVFKALMLGSICLPAAAVQAQEAPEKRQSSSPNVIVVTAQKQEESVQDVAISIKVLDSETLDKTLATGLDDLTRLVPSLSMTSISRGGNQVQIRGLGSNVGSVGTVALYNDNVISAGRSQSGGAFNERDSGLYDIERVEVLRGPQGTLYGEGSLGGVINIISKRPNASQIEASGSASAFVTDGADDISFDLQAMINIPIAEDVFAVRGVFYRFDRAGYIDAVNGFPFFFGNPAELIQEDANTQIVTGGRVLAKLTPNDTFDATLILKKEDVKLGISDLVSPRLIDLVNGAGGTTFNPERSQLGFGPDIGSTLDSEEAILEVNVDLGFAKLSSVSGWGDLDQFNISNSAGFNSEALSQELRLASSNDGDFNWIVGGFYRDAERSITLAAAPFLDEDRKSWSIFGQAYVNLTPQLEATIGLRYEEQESKIADLANALPTQTANFNSVLPKFTLNWNISDDDLIYANVAKGFRGGGVNVDISVGTDPAFVAPFDPDTIWNYEIGTKLQFWDQRVTLNAAAFYIDWSDIQIDRAIVSLVNPPLGFIVVNGAKAHSFGIEADLYINPTPDWEIVVGGSIVNAEYDSGTIDTALGLNVPLDGNTLPSTPSYLFNASIERKFTISQSTDGYVRSDFSYRGNSFGDVPNTPAPGGKLRSGSSKSLNLRLGMRSEVWEAQVYVTNLTNERDSSYRFDDGGFADLQSLLRPRTVGLNLKLRYN